MVWSEFVRTLTGTNKDGDPIYVNQWMPVTGTRKLFFQRLYVPALVDFALACR
jgi:hypothetical protein